MHWPQKVTTFPGVTIEAHAKWCPVEHARQSMGAEIVAFAESLKPQCECMPGYFLNGVRIGCLPPMTVVRES